MNEYNTVYSVRMCSVQEMATIYPDRVVAIRGPSVDSMSNAEAALSAKLRECHQRDYVSMTRVRYLISTTTTTTTTITTTTIIIITIECVIGLVV